MSNDTGGGMLVQGQGVPPPQTGEAAPMVPPAPETAREEAALDIVRSTLKEGWTVHTGRDGRLYYCNHITRTAGWLPPAESWSSGVLSPTGLPFGWEKAIDHTNRPYYINHLNKTTTYEAPYTVVEVSGLETVDVPVPRQVTLNRDPELGFGFVAGSERPVVVRFVTEGGPSVDKLEPGDQILSVNGEDVGDAPREHVIKAVRACQNQVTLVVCQPRPVGDENTAGRRSALLSRGRRARLRSRPARVRFAESVCVNGSPLFPPSAFSLGDLCLPPMANVLKVFLENGQTKSFKYDSTTTVSDVVTSLKDKLCLSAGEHFSLVVEHVKSLRRNKLTLLDPKETLAMIASRPGAHKLRCLFRVTFVPTSAADLAQRDLNSMDYLYMQCCNDVAQERFAPELQPEVALRLAALHMHQHALAHNMSPAKLTVKAAEREFGLERFVPCGLLETMKRKELRRLIGHFLKLNSQMTGNQQKYLSQLQAKLHYLDIISSLPSYGAKCFSSNQPERVLLVSPRFGLSQIAGIRNSIPTLISNLEDLVAVRLTREDEISHNVTIYFQQDRVLSFSMEDRDGSELALVLAGYYKLVTGKDLDIDQEREPIMDDIAPPYVSQHNVVPAKWSYLNSEDPNIQSKCHYVTFTMPPPYHSTPKMNFNGLDTNMNSTLTNKNHSIINNSPLYEKKQSNRVIRSIYDNYNENDSEFEKSGNFWGDDGFGFDLPSIMSFELLENMSDPKLIEAKNEEVLKRVTEMQKLVENSEQYLNEHGDIVYKNMNGSENGVGWYETSVDKLESDNESNHSRMSSLDDTPGILKHSDSLTLLTETINQGLNGLTTVGLSPNTPAQKTLVNGSDSSKRQNQSLSAILNNSGIYDALMSLNTDLSQSESDNDSLYTPTNSPIHKHQQKNMSIHQKAIRTSFGLHCPESSFNSNLTIKDQNFKDYLGQFRNNINSPEKNTAKQPHSNNKDFNRMNGDSLNLIDLEPDLIDLTLLPPPQTPDELDGVSHVPQVIPSVPISFADKSESVQTIVECSGKKNETNIENKTDLDKFLATVIVEPPTQKITPAVELTPEEIMSYIIPPPPLTNGNSDSPNAIYSNDEVRNISMTKGVPNGQTVKSNISVSEIRDMFNAKSLSQARNSLILNEKNIEKNNVTDVPFINVDSSSVKIQNGVNVKNSYVIDYPTVDRKGVFSCCAKDNKSNNDCNETLANTNECEVKPPPRISKQELQKPPERPPKSLNVTSDTRPRSNSFSYSNTGFSLPQPNENRFNTLNGKKVSETNGIIFHSIPTNCTVTDDKPPIIPPRSEPVSLNIPPHILLPPKKPPLPPVPTVEVLRMKANLKNLQSRNGSEPKVASINSPHLQRSVNFCKNIESEFENNCNDNVNNLQGPQRSRTQSQPNCGVNCLSVPSTPTAQNKTGHVRSHSETKNTILKNREINNIFTLCSPQMNRKVLYNESPMTKCNDQSCMLKNSQYHCNSKMVVNKASSPLANKKIHENLSGGNGYAISADTLLQKTEVAVDGLLQRLHQVAQTCSIQHSQGGGEDIDERKFQEAKDQLTNEAVALVTSSRTFVAALASGEPRGIAMPLADCLTPLRKLADLSQALGRHTSSPLQTRNLVLRVHDVTAAFKELAGAEMAKILKEHLSRSSNASQTENNVRSLEGQLALRAECLANVLATLLRSLRVFSP